MNHEVITQGMSSFFLSVKFFFTYLMTPIGSTNDQNTMHRVI